MNKREQLIDLLNKADTYEKRTQINVEKLGIVEKKQGKFKYISWTYADIILRTLDPEAKWEPFQTPFANFVGISITFKGVEHRTWYPILDMANQGSVMDIEEGLLFWQKKTKSADEGRKAKVTSMEINNSIMRGFAKDVSKITGVGIDIYSGEDLSQYDNSKFESKADIKDVEAAKAAYHINKDIGEALLRQMISIRPAIVTGASSAEGYIDNLNLEETKRFIDEVA